MKVILLANVDHVGKKDQVVEVSDGYAKNYLLRNKLAILATEENLSNLAQKLEDLSQQKQLENFQNISLKEYLEKEPYIFTLKVNNNKCFGSITNKDIIDKINANKEIVTKSMFHDQHKLTLGEHEIIINLSKDVKAKLKIIVKGI